MKPIRLKLAGMHSYREMQEIDFETLCQAGLFGIFGPTGSGKSTILDAITLALYGQVVRLGGGNHPKEVLNQLEQRVFVSFTFELGKGSDRRQYTVEREFGLDKKGNKRQPEVRLIQLGHLTGEPDVVLESKATSATAAVEALIGLTLQDFTRAVVLPQGQFSRFLTLKGSERNEMLQRMFRLHIYGEKLSERVRHALDQAKEQMHQLQLEMAALGDAGVDALEEAKQIWTAAARQEQEFREQKQGLANKIKELEQLHQWLQEMESVQTQLQALFTRQEEIADLKARIRDWESSIRMWPMLQQWQRLDEEWHATEQALARSREEQVGVQLALQEAEADYERAQTRHAAEEPLLIEQKGRLALAEEWEVELGRIREEWTALEREWQEVRTALEQTEARLAKDEAALQLWEQEWKHLEEQTRAVTVTPEWRDQVGAAREAKQQWNRDRIKQQELMKELEDLAQQAQRSSAEAAQHRRSWEESAARLQQVRERWTALEANPGMTDSEWDRERQILNDMKQAGRQWREQLQQQAGWQEKENHLEQERKQAETILARYEADWQEKEALVARKQLEWDKLKQEWEQWQQENMARFLRERLEVGQECPVCGSTHHAHEASSSSEPGNNHTQGDELRARIKAAEAALREAEQQSRQVKESLLTAKVEHAALEERQTALLSEQKQIEEKIEAIRKECWNEGEPWTVQSFEELLAVYQREEKELLAKQTAREQAKLEREQLQKQVEKLREEESAELRLLERSRILQEQLEKAIAEGRLRLDTATKEAQRSADELEARRGDLPVEEIEQRFEELGRLDRRLAELQALRAEKEALRKTLLAACESAKKQQSEGKGREANLQERLEDRKRMWEQKHALWLERTGGKPAQECLRQVEDTLSGLRQTVSATEAKRKACADQREQVQSNLVKYSEAYAVLTKQRNEAQEALQSALQESGIQTVERVRELYAARDGMEHAQSQVQSYEQAMGQLRYDEHRLNEAIAGRTVTREEVLAAKEAWEEWEHSFQEAQKQVAVAKEHVDRMESNHSKWLELQVRLEEQQDEQSRLEELKKLFEAKAFVQFIAEEKLVSIARDASYHLKKMTANRYGLEIGDEGEFVLRDEAAGGLRRPVSTLSGGETFLTSLSLALALSMEIQMRGGRLEFFFLDEGFGTLDPELLETVMDALERLRMEDFTIGVISHVPEIRVRMPRRLVVTPAEPMGAGSRLNLEME
ncbi:SbcC/MukB-like Walker B domain-containing protein [Brevibacillus sp. AY1]|uniref:AAA family ATPase n=1 Tax=Brevibacillus sp. AY1 TaxID=2807621 RepID=UPI002456E2D7|nr:SbcC/MukB-like Walker B domain-containing protein [Brevibacillus sp. AY1]MDH4616301.1 AAA family ATPase [Brevibacillus sp. AY1]